MSLMGQEVEAELTEAPVLFQQPAAETHTALLQALLVPQGMTPRHEAQDTTLQTTEPAGWQQLPSGALTLPCF